MANGTPLTLDALRAQVRRIPRGKVSTYGDVAEAAGYPGCARQVVWALQDSTQLRLPWHRVVGAGGKIRLSGENGMEQRLRLEAERVRFRGSAVDMALHRYDFSGEQAGTPTRRGTRRPSR